MAGLKLVYFLLGEIMKKSFKFLGILFITAVFLVGCQGQKDFSEG